MEAAMTPEVRDALIAAGGCQHTPEPHRACDTCGRPPTEWANKKGNVAFGWQATLDDGSVVDKRDVLSVANLPLDRVCNITVKTDSLQFPEITITVDPSKGERLWHFTRHFESFSNDGERKGHATMLVFEVRYDLDNPKRWVRLYLHPHKGPILSTQDLYV